MIASPARHRRTLISLISLVALATAVVASLAALAPSTASAALVAGQTAESCATYEARTDWGGVSQSAKVDRFALAGMQLTAANVTRTVDIYSDLSITSYNNGSTSIMGSLNGNVEMDAGHGLAALTDPLAENVNETMPSGTGAFTKRYDTPVTSDTTRITGTDLAGWNGAGQNVFTGTSTATDSVTASGNYDKSVRTVATMKVCVTYEYLESVTVCIGDYVWIDADKDGVQDSNEQPVPARSVTVTDAAGQTLGTTTTDASGRWTICNLEPNVKCVVRVDLPDGWSISPVNQGDDATDSDGLAFGADASIDCVTPPRGNDFTFDVGIYRNPQAVDTPNAAQGQPAVLRIAKRAVTPTVRAGGTATFVVTVRNRASVAVADVTVCDTPPSQLAFKTRPRGSYFRNGKLCWNIARLGANQARTFRYTMRAANVSRTLCVTNAVRAAASAGGAASSSARQCIRSMPQAVDAPLPLAG